MSTSEQNKIAYLKYKPFPIRLGDLKGKMQLDAFERGSTIHAIAVEILRNYYEKREVVYDTQLQKLIEMCQIKRHNIKHHVYRKKYGDLATQLKMWG